MKTEEKRSAEIESSIVSLGEDRRYWKQRLSEVAGAGLLPEFGERQPAGRGRLRLSFDSELTKQLADLSGRHEERAHVVFLGTVIALIHRYSQAQLCSVRAGLPRSQVVGGVNHSLPLCVSLSANDSFRELLLKVRDEYQHVSLHDTYSVDRLIADFEQSSGRDVTWLSQCGVFHGGIHQDEAAEECAISFVLSDRKDEAGFIVHWEQERFPLALVEQLSESLLLLAKTFWRQLSTDLSAAPILTSEKAQALWSAQEAYVTEYPSDVLVHELFLQQAEARAEKTALVHRGGEWTYGELKDRALRLAETLSQELGVTKGDRVAILLERSAEAIVTMLATISLGAMYVPIDTAAAGARREKILRKTAAKVLVTHSDWMFDTEGHTGQLFIVDLQFNELPAASSKVAPVEIEPSDAAYIMYTSGTSGEPKGVVIPHRGIVRLVRDTNYISLGERDRLLLTGSLSFDATTFEIWGMLLNGGTLIVEPQETLLDQSLLKDAMTRNRVTVMWFTSQWFTQLVDEDPDMFSVGKQLLTGGDVVSRKHVEIVRRRSPELEFLHVYGPTENTTFSTCQRVRREYERPLPLGEPISNTQAFVVDDQMRLLPPYAWGEIVLAGDGLALGYFGDESETARKFVDVELVPGQKTRVYRTGDMGRILPDGEFEFRGRADGQVKIRGFRVEVKEIEEVLRKIDEVKDVRVRVKVDERGDKSLCAYVVTESGKKLHQFKETASSLLPDYMVPYGVVFLEKFPLTINGKLDERRLPEPDLQGAAAYEAPLSEEESYLEGVFGDVLGVDRSLLGRNANFFDQGGHSLKATLLLSRVHRERGVQLSLSDVFESSTLAELALRLGSARKTSLPSIERASDDPICRASSQQARMCMLQELQPQSTAYNIPMAFEWRGSLSLERLEGALEKLSSRHEALRTTLSVREGVVYQEVHENLPLHFVLVKDVSGSWSEHLTRLVRPFALAQEAPLRAFVLRTSADSSVLLFDGHHAVLDAVSIEVLLRDLAAFYNEEELPEQEIRYRDYSNWQNGEAFAALIAGSEAYWRGQFASPVAPLNLPLSFPRPAVRNFEGRTLRFSLDDDTYASLQRLARENDATMYMCLLTCICAWLRRITPNDEFVVGCPIAGRTQPELAEVVGMFVNTLALRCPVDSKQSWLQLLAVVKERVLQGSEHQLYPFEELVEAVLPERDLSRNPLFDVMFALQNAASGTLSVDGAEISTHYFDTGTAKFDLNIWCGEEDGRFQFALEYDAALFSLERAQQFVDQILETIGACCRAPAASIGEIQCLPAHQRERLILRAGSDDAHDLSTPLFHHVERRAAQCPAQVAVRFRSDFLTYEELNKQANQLARALSKSGVSGGGVVAIHLPKCLELIVSIVAIQKALCGFVVLDPSLPKERREFMLNDAGASALISLEPCAWAFDVARLTPSAPNESTDNLGVRPDSESLAYLIYTSGSTGTPKGARLSHRSLASFAHGMSTSYHEGMGPQDVCLSITTTSFDAFIAELAMCFFHGATFVIVPSDSALDAEAVAETMNAHGVSFAYLPLVLLGPIAQALSREGRTSLRKLMIGAEPINDSTVKRWLALNPDLQVQNAYGPTEATVCATLYDCLSHEYKNELLPIGFPMPNVRIFLVDEHLRLVPDGCIGEILIGGSGVGLGYTDEELTRERFIQLELDGTRRTYYRTGDLARWTEGLGLIFQGRTDSQIKIRGVRIEPGEVEAVLSRHEAIQEAVVQVRRDPQTKQQTLVAYYLADGPQDSAKLRAWARSKLPSYSVPERFVYLEEPPTLTSGKLDRKSMPDLIAQGDIERRICSPSTAVQQRLVELWSDVLALSPSQIDVETSFFDMGGNSLRLIELLPRIRTALGVELKPVDLFSASTIVQLARLCGEDAAAAGVEDFSL